jgi:stromal membrane-associated protein
MGTHISRVKSVDLDAWTDEQLQSVLKWGNSRANKYWESKLAPGHVPSESKIENFIRTKYESKRWVMEGPIPDPSTLDAEGDDDVPLSLVKEKHNIERSASQRAGASPAPGPSQIRRAPQQDLFADDDAPTPRANTTGPISSRPPPKAEQAPPKQTKPADSLLGLDFFGEEAPPNRPASAAATPGAQSRPDLKQSILSLYASKPAAPQQPSHSSSGSFGGMQQAPPMPQQSSRQSSFGGMNDAFGGLGFSNPSFPPVQVQSKPNAFSNLGNISSHRSPPSEVSPPPPNLGGGSFFDSKPVQRSSQPPSQPSRGFSSSSGFGAFDSAPGLSSDPVSNTNPSSGLGDLFDFSTAAPQPPPKQTATSPTTQPASVFNLSQAAAKPQPPAATSGWGNNDTWGSNDAWSSSTTNPPMAKAAPSPASTADFGWGSGGSLANQRIVPGGGGGFSTASQAPPKVSADEDFGGWSSAAPVTPAAGTSSKPGFAASEDLFSNVWE